MRPRVTTSLVTASALLLLASPAAAQVGVLIHGRVEDASSRQRIAGARVFAADSSTSVMTDSAGVFAILLASGEPLAVHVEQYGYLSQRFDLPGRAVSGISVLRLEPSPIRLEGIDVVEESKLARLLRDLRARRNAYWGSVAAFDRLRLERFRGSVWDFVRMRAPAMYECNEALSGLCVRGRGVSFVDPYPEVSVRVCVDSWESWGAVSELAGMDIQDVALVEIYSQGRGGLRIYTPRYLLSSASRGRTVVHPYGC